MNESQNHTSGPQMAARFVGVLSVLFVACGPPNEPVAPEAEASPPAAAPAPAPTQTEEEAPPPAEGETESTDTAAGAEAEGEETQHPGPERPGALPPGSPLDALMRHHFKETQVIRSAVINGNITAAVAPARALTDLSGVEKLPVDWKLSVNQLKAASSRIGNSPDVPATAAATADIGLACGGCHKKVGGPKVKVGPAPEAGETLATRMARHAWATERLWEGLFVPSDKAWKAGAEALHGAPFPKEVLKAGGVHGRSAAKEFEHLVAQAADKKTPEERAALYSSLLGTCASCHMAARGN